MTRLEPAGGPARRLEGQNVLHTLLMLQRVHRRLVHLSIQYSCRVVVRNRQLVKRQRIHFVNTHRSLRVINTATPGSGFCLEPPYRIPASAFRQVLEPQLHIVFSNSYSDLGRRLCRRGRFLLAGIFVINQRTSQVWPPQTAVGLIKDHAGSAFQTAENLPPPQGDWEPACLLQDEAE